MIDMDQHIQAINDPEEPALVAMPSITIFNLRQLDGQPMKTHAELRALRLHEMMPNLKEFSIGGSSHACWVCGFLVPGSTAQVDACVQAMVQSIRGHLPKLTVIKTDWL